MWWCVRIDTSDDELAADALWAQGAESVEVRAGSAGAVVVGGFAAEPAARAAAARLRHSWPATVEVVDDPAWQDAWRRWAAPVRVGRLVIRPAWVEHHALPGDVVVDLEPGRCFGSGAHETTKLALRGLLEHVRPGAAVLDVGCGSGVLAVAAALLGAASVVAIDVDEEAVRCTEQNAVRNRVAGAVRASTTPLAGVTGCFVVVVANLGGSRVVVDNAAHLARVTAPGGALLVSGLLRGAAGDAVAALRQVADVAAVVAGDEWAMVVARRPPTTSAR